MTPSSTTILKYANIQMASEALILAATAAPGSIAVNRELSVAVLTTGNNRASRFTTSAATEFAAEWTVVEHISNTQTGFSGTLFKNKNTNELVMSLRSTEFADDAARDNEATNALEITKFGWAFGQIADMDKWYKELRTKYSPDFAAAGGKLSVTGYSLGGHLAGAFVQMRIDEETFDTQVKEVYTFNGAGVGNLRNQTGLSTTITEFQRWRSDGGNADLFQSAEGMRLYQKQRGLFKLGNANASSDMQLARNEISAVLGRLSAQDTQTGDTSNRQITTKTRAATAFRACTRSRFGLKKGGGRNNQVLHRNSCCDQRAGAHHG